MHQPPASPLLVGTVIGAGYHVVQLLASGGSGHVYLAEREDDLTRVAIKALRTEHKRTPDLVRRFRREAEAAARVKHPNVLAVLDAPFASDDVLCFAMELLVGLDLADTLGHFGKLESPRAVGIAADVAHGLEAAHAAGVVHRDVKPENIFLVHAADGRETVKIFDFGYASVRGEADPSWDVRGTPEYMAPEQARGAAGSPSGDVYALGVVLFEMLTGRRPRHGEALGTDSVCGGPVASRELEAVVRRALATRTQDRFASMAELAKGLLATPEALALGALSSGRHSGKRRISSLLDVARPQERYGKNQ